MKLRIVQGDLLDQPVEVIVNAWNRNVIAWWLLLPQGVSGAIKKRGGYQPFKELARMGSIPAGGARLTSAGKLPFKAIIHVAAINLLWRASPEIVRNCTANALATAAENLFSSIAIPLIGSGTGGLKPEKSKSYIIESAESSSYQGEIVIVEFPRRAS